MAKKNQFNAQAKPAFGPLEQQMWNAEMAGDVAGMFAAIDAGAQVDAVRPGLPPAHRRTLFESWSFDPDTTVAKKLLEKGADINHANYQGDTVLFSAISIGREDMVDFLLANGASLTQLNKKGQNAVQRAYNMMSTNKINKAYANIWEKLSKCAGEEASKVGFYLKP